jgi:hypothetical protein
MVLAIIVVIVAIIAGVCVVEVVAETDPRSKFVFALLDRLVSDESLLDVPEMSASAAAKRYSSHAA